MQVNFSMQNAKLVFDDFSANFTNARINLTATASWLTCVPLGIRGLNRTTDSWRRSTAHRVVRSTNFVKGLNKLRFAAFDLNFLYGITIRNVIFSVSLTVLTTWAVSSIPRSDENVRLE